jgi:Fibronectin type III domain/Viral BACON domain
MFGNTFHGRISRTSLLILTCLFALISLILFSPPGLNAAQVTLAWDPSTDPHVTGFRLYYGTSSRSYQFKDDAGKNTTFTISNLQDGTTYYFAVTARDAAGIESEYSNEISYNTTATCQYSISPASQSVGFLGGPRTLSVSSQPDCTWTAVSNVSWLVITSNSSGMGNGTVNYSVNANSSSSSRKGKMTVAGQTFTISQKSSTYYTTERGNSGN